MSLAIISLNYDWSNKLSLQTLTLIRNKFPQFFEESGKPKDYWSVKDEIVDVEELEFLVRHEVAITLKRFKSLYSPNSLIPSLQEAGVVNHIHLPNFSLSSFTEVDVLENCCTGELQRSLNNGWRIIAVCPPYDKRRPDYIIARTPNKE